MNKERIDHQCVAIDSNGRNICDVPYYLYEAIVKKRYKQTALWIKQGRVYLNMILLQLKSIILIAPAVWFICCAAAIHMNVSFIKSISVADIFAPDLIRLVFFISIAIVIFCCAINPHRYGYEDIFHCYLVDELKRECPQLQFVQERVEFVSFAIGNDKGQENVDS